MKAFGEFASFCIPNGYENVGRDRGKGSPISQQLRKISLVVTTHDFVKSLNVNVGTFNKCSCSWRNVLRFFPTLIRGRPETYGRAGQANNLAHLQIDVL
jgi:hypothetical protein